MKKNWTLTGVLSLGLALALSSCSGGKSDTKAPAGAASAAGSETAVAESMITALEQGDMTGACKDFDATMQGAMPAAKLEEVWQGLIAQQGALQSTANTRVTQVGATRVVLVTCTFERGQLDLQVTMDANNKVSGFFIRPANFSL